MDSESPNLPLWLRHVEAPPNTKPHGKKTCRAECCPLAMARIYPDFHPSNLWKEYMFAWWPAKILVTSKLISHQSRTTNEIYYILRLFLCTGALLVEVDEQFMLFIDTYSSYIYISTIFYNEIHTIYTYVCIYYIIYIYIYIFVIFPIYQIHHPIHPIYGL